MLWKNHENQPASQHSQIFTEKKTSCSTFRFAQNDSKKNKNKKHPGVKAPHLHIELESLKGQWPSVHFQKKNMNLTATAATSGIAPEHLGHQPGPKGPPKNLKRLVLRNNTFGWFGFFQCWEEKGWILLGWLFFFADDFLLLRMIFESYFFDLFWEIWILLDDFFLKKAGFLRQAGLHGRLW